MKENEISMIDACVDAMILAFIDSEIEKEIGISILKETKKMKTN